MYGNVRIGAILRFSNSIYFDVIWVLFRIKTCFYDFRKNFQDSQVDVIVIAFIN